MIKTEQEVDKTAFGIFTLVFLAYVYIFWQILRTLWPAVVQKWNCLASILHKAGPGQCDTACTLSLLPPGMTIGGLLLVMGFVVAGFYFSIVMYKRLAYTCLSSS